MSTTTDPLAGGASALLSFRSRLEQSSSTLRNLVDHIKNAATAIDHLRPAAGDSTSAVRRTRANADTAARSLTNAGRAAGQATSGVKSAGGRTKRGLKAVGKLAVGLGGVLALVAGLIDLSGPLGDLMDRFGTAMTIGSGVMMVINLVTKANPIGFVTGILLPVAGWLLDLAMNSETGQRLMEQLATLVLKYVEGYLTILTPVLKVIASVVSTYVTGYLRIVVGALTVLSAVIGTGFAVLNALTTGDTHALSGRMSAIWRGFKSAVKPVLDWIGKHIPQMFQRAKDAVSGTLHGMGQFVTTGAQTVAGVVKGPIQGLIAFANWIIDGLNHLSFNFFGKKFGVHLSKIPMLAEGGIAVPGTHARAGRVLPLTALERQRALAARRRTTVTVQPRYRIREFHESHGAGAHAIATDLLFLASAHACA